MFDDVIRRLADMKYAVGDSKAINTAIKSLEAWEKIDDDIASLQDIYSISGTDTEKAIWENLQAVRKTIHAYLSEVSE